MQMEVKQIVKNKYQNRIQNHFLWDTLMLKKEYYWIQDITQLTENYKT